jgi:hypothetical protein
VSLRSVNNSSTNDDDVNDGALTVANDGNDDEVLVDVVDDDDDGRELSLFINEAKKPPMDDNDGNKPLPLLDDVDDVVFVDDVVAMLTVDDDERTRTAGASNDGIDVDEEFTLLDAVFVVEAVEPNEKALDDMVLLVLKRADTGG